jgi:hypothetical protein
MSLNKLLIEGKVGDGLDLEVKSLSTSAGGGSLIRGSLTVAGSTDLQGITTCEDSLSVVGDTTLFGKLSLGNPAFSVNLNGILPVVDQGFTPQAGHISNASSYDQTYQKEGSTLKIQGRFVADLTSIVLSRYFTVGFTLPAEYAISGSVSGRYASVSGNGANLAVLQDTQPYVCGNCSVLSPNTYTLIFFSGDGSDPRVVNSQMFFSYQITFDSVVDIIPIPP